ncbi:unnamed protein product [Dibothriocephalus latus]|uniref:Uncharacterized protein n=1 Tax=Dibothriocephalus latus TaxID=60516 RepID=A0A3P7LHS4_DIBLA|nr:unnamed protein product [Dibothriocephalus latus]
MNSIVRKVCVLLFILSNYAINWILGKALHEEDNLKLATQRRRTDLEYTNDFTLLSSIFGDLQSMVSRGANVSSDCIRRNHLLDIGKSCDNEKIVFLSGDLVICEIGLSFREKMCETRQGGPTEVLEVTSASPKVKADGGSLDVDRLFS